MSIVEKLNQIKSSIPGHVRLIAVSKTHPQEMILEAYEAGQRIFGENKVQELCEKQKVLPPDIEWHYIGHLQRNKVKFIVPFVSLIHAVDSLRLLAKINQEAKKCNRIVRCLLQFHIAEEGTKFGMSFEEAKALLQSEEYKSMNNTQLCGVMGMATRTQNKKQISKEFAHLQSYFEKLKSDFFADDPNFTEISSGMSSDYFSAIEKGSTLIRVGSKIFGERTYLHQ
ncbi:MAG: YggS family pyridoxal phosphate-dependent enzyme [Bacteroidia bacterium]|nr:MAG: YggS family pyridoxal phosphate-dependent enzyme [Bacteroidia bacterium]